MEKFHYEINQEPQWDPTGEKAQALNWLDGELRKRGKDDHWIQDRKYYLHEILNPPIPETNQQDQETPMEIARQYLDSLHL